MRQTDELYDSESRGNQSQMARISTLANQQKFDELYGLTKQSYGDIQEENMLKLKDATRKGKLEEKRRALSRNAVPILGILAGTTAIAAGAATAQIPVVTVGIFVFVAALSKLKGGKEEKKKRGEESYANC
ncbi:hypothetical protein F4808DRAFT_304983 [Astrocystis sublimbata]|nr:hypothetical protein F4808DRAFT_304983 [Astrocystis sublimbata]